MWIGAITPSHPANAAISIQDYLFGIALLAAIHHIWWNFCNPLTVAYSIAETRSLYEETAAALNIYLYVCMYGDGIRYNTWSEYDNDENSTGVT